MAVHSHCGGKILEKKLNNFTGLLYLDLKGFYLYTNFVITFSFLLIK